MGTMSGMNSLTLTKVDAPATRIAAVGFSPSATLDARTFIAAAACTAETSGFRRP